MPVTNLSNRTILTNAQAGTAMRLHSDATTDVPEPLNSIIERLLNMSAALIRKRTTPDLPEAVLIESIIQLSIHFYDQPIGRRGDALRRSGVQDLLAPYRKRRSQVVSP